MNGHVSHLPEIVANGHKNIISIAVLECELPQDWVDALNLPEVKQIWTISEFCKTLIEESGVKTPVKVIYLGLNKAFHKKEVNIFPRDESFKFLNVCAPHCIGKRDRKGLDILISAFKKEFGDDLDVKLILKINAIYADNVYRQLGKQFNLNKYLGLLLPKGASTCNISIITAYFSAEDLNNLYNSVECGVFPSRGEGLGMPIAEMMKIGKPVICTEYSAHTEFSMKNLQCSIKGMWPLDYQNLPPYYDSRFGEPDEESLRKIMRDMYSRYIKYHNEVKALPKIFEEFDWDVVGQKMDSHIKELKEKIKGL